MSGRPVASVVISTKNRKDELRKALASVQAQSAPVEIVVLDDGSTDGTEVVVREEFPGVTLMRFAESAGYIVRRNQGAARAAAPIVISLDDDAIFDSPDTVAQTVGEFDAPIIGAVAIPYVDVGKDTAVRQRSPSARIPHVAAQFRGTAYAVRRELFLRLGGFREQWVHQGEEGDFCIRLLESGHVVRLGAAPPIRHFESPNRNLERMAFYGRRNDVLFAWHNVPMPDLLPHLAATTVNGLRTASRAGFLGPMLRGLWAGYAESFRAGRARRPVSRQTYGLFRQLRRDAARPLAEVAGKLRAPAGN